jgi:hypothetical protein
MAIDDKTRRMTRATFGDLRSLGGGNRNLLSISYGYKHLKRLVPAASTTAVHAAITGSASVVTTVTTSITNPTVTRNLTVTSAGTAGDIATGDVTITGTNTEGKVITETFTFAADTAATITGSKAFKTVTSIAIPVQDGAGATFAVGTGAKLGIHHRLASTAGTGTVRVISVVPATGVQTLQAAPSAVATDATNIEGNTVTPATTPNGTTSLSIHYFFYNWTLNPTNGNPTYGA